jgi:hypothetical protein
MSKKKNQLYDACTVMNCLLIIGLGYSAVPNLSIAFLKLFAGLYKRAARYHFGCNIQSEVI